MLGEMSIRNDVSNLFSRSVAGRMDARHKTMNERLSVLTALTKENKTKHTNPLIELYGKTKLSVLKCTDGLRAPLDAETLKHFPFTLCRFDSDQKTFFVRLPTRV